MNKVILIGRLCNEVETRSTQSGTSVATYRLAVNRDFKKDGQPDADFLTCVAFGSNADFADKYLRKGTKIAVEGRISTRSYEDKDGKTVYVTEILVDRHEFCESKRSAEESTGGNYGGYANNNARTANVNDFESVGGGLDDLPF